jgi:hypothetical protein
MESIFQITDDTTTVNMLRQPALLTKDKVDDWVLSLTTGGVPDPLATNSRLPVCPYDRTNLEWSYDAVLNS